MVLSNKQKLALNKLPAAQRANAARNFVNQNRVQNSRGRTSNLRGRGNSRGRQAPRSGRGNTQRVRRQQISAPVSRGSVVERQQSTTNTLVRTFYIETFKVPNIFDPVTAQVVDISPTNMPWLNQFSNLYGRFKFNFYKYRFVTSTATSVSGSVWAAVQPVSTNVLPNSLADIQQFSQHKIGPVYNTWKQFAAIPPHLLKERWFRTTIQPQDSQGSLPDFADVVPARILFGTLALNPQNVSGDVGFLEVHVSVTFADPHSVFLGNTIEPPLDKQVLVMLRRFGDRTFTEQFVSINVVEEITFDVITLQCVSEDGKRFTLQADSLLVNPAPIKGSPNERDSIKVTGKVAADNSEFDLNVSEVSITQGVEDGTLIVNLSTGDSSLVIIAILASMSFSSDPPRDPKEFNDDEVFMRKFADLSISDRNRFLAIVNQGIEAIQEIQEEENDEEFTHV